MFYSQTILARKGPLGTVWTAAHLQNRLSKSQYTSTNIPETIELIMFPEAPMALRMSGHLLLGIVRIYSKKVDYFFRDCTLFTNQVAKAFISTQVDLPKDARQAPVESVTLPQTLNLEDFDLEEDETLEREFDNHLRSQEDITLTDQIPTGVDPYVAVTFDDDIIQESTPMDINQGTVPVTVSEHHRETDVEMAHETEPNSEMRDFNVDQDTETFGPRNDTEEIPEFHDPRPSSLTEPLDTSPVRTNVNSPRSVPEIEIMRDAVRDLSPPPSAAQQESARVEGTEPLDETLYEKEPTIPILDEEMLGSRGHSTFELRSGSPGFAGTEEERGNFVHPSPQLVLQPSPPPQAQARPRQRKRLFDRVTVLTNRFLSERLEDPSDTIRKRMKLPSSKVNVWRLKNQSKKDQIVQEPLLTGVSDDLRSLFEKDYVSSKPYLAISEETIPEPAPVSSPTQEAETEEIIPTSPVPQSEVPVQQTEDVQEVTDPQSARTQSVATEARSPQTFTNDDIEIERLRDGGYPEYMPSPPPGSSAYRTDDSATQPGTWDTGSYRTEPSTSKHTGSYMTEPSTSKHTGSYMTEPSTSENTEDSSRPRHSGLSAIPEMTDEDLNFLEVGSNTPGGSPGSHDTDALTGRSRALANYLKERSSSSPTSSKPSGDLSLGKILEGKKRKIAARMFFETLVLKSRGLIDMHQDEPYGDISLKLMPALFSKVQL